jgi:hypothetical protein
MPKYEHPTQNGGGVQSIRLTSMEQRRMRDVEEFELGGLLEEEEEEADKRDSSSMEHQPLAKKRSSIDHETL